MERLPYIDEHAIYVTAGRADTWHALLRVICRDPHDPSSVPPGFALDEAHPPKRLTLKGRHLFAHYLWTFELDDVGPRCTRVRSATWARFPGLHGRIYRALVIGTGAHRVVVQRTLRRIAAHTFDCPIGDEAADYADIFEAELQLDDRRTAEQTFRDALGHRALLAGVQRIHRHILRFQLEPLQSADHVIGWSVMRSDVDEMVLAADGPLMHGELNLRRQDGRRAVLTTRLHYRHRIAGRAVWLMVGPLHRAIAPQLVKHAARVAV